MTGVAVRRGAVRIGITGVRRYLARNPSLAWGLALAAGLVLFMAGGSLAWDTTLAEPLSAPVARPPSWAHPFGTDTQGRDLLAVMIVGTRLTLKIGMIAGGIGVLVGAAVGFTAAYAGGRIDAAIRTLTDVLLTVPALLFLIVVASSLKGEITSTTMGLMIAALSWMAPARQIRAQALVLRGAPYVVMARLGGMRGTEIVLREMLPNLLPFLMASFVLALAQAILASVGLEALGLGAQDEPTLGMTVYWMMSYSAFVRGFWWWIAAPIVALCLVFVALYLVTAGLDEIANPRLKRRVVA
ncbi:MAG: ABC transporter permease [Rhodospirillales bacterium]